MDYKKKEAEERRTFRLYSKIMSFDQGGTDYAHDFEKFIKGGCPKEGIRELYQSGPKEDRLDYQSNIEGDSPDKELE
jgi:hypothetical protein